MRDSYLSFLAEPILHHDGKTRPRVRHPMKWAKINPTSKTDSFVSITSLLLEKDVWIWSDHHFYHEKVIQYSNRPSIDADSMNALMIKNYIETVKEGDVCIWAGDIFFKSPELFKNEILPLLNKTYNILVVGNHDFNGKKVKDMGFDEVHLLLEFDYKDKHCVVSHYPFHLTDLDFVNVHGHIHQNKSEFPHQINVSVEAINYKPVSLKELLDNQK